MGRVTLHLYRSVLYFANLLLCSAAILPKERGFENQERTAREKQAEDTHVNPTRAPVKTGWSSSQAAHIVKLVRGLRGRGATGPLMKVMALPSKHIKLGFTAETPAAWTLQGMVSLHCSPHDFAGLLDNFQRRKKLAEPSFLLFGGPDWLLQANSVLLGKHNPALAFSRCKAQWQRVKQPGSLRAALMGPSLAQEVRNFA